MADIKKIDVDGVTYDIKDEAAREDVAALNEIFATGVLPISKGGTGATDGETAQNNLFASGITVLSAHQYGTELPSAGVKGQLFFLKVVE